MTVISLPSSFNFSSYKAVDVDVCHSEEPSVATYFAEKLNPSKKHIVTFQDPMYVEELKKSQWSFDPRWRSIYHRTLTEARWRAGSLLVNKAVRGADALFSQAKYIIPKITSMFKLKEPPKFLPNPVKIPRRRIEKADVPTVCFLGRWDSVKRVELFFDLARKFSNVEFVALGKAHSQERDSYLRKSYEELPNLKLPGFVSEEEKSQILERSWILINTSIRECLPVSFLEAAAHDCAILSCNNPDNFAKDFGYYVTDGDFNKGLDFLLQENRWKERGRKAGHYVRETHALDKVIEEHIEVYKSIIER